jgi:hypothetical protein
MKSITDILNMPVERPSSDAAVTPQRADVPEKPEDDDDSPAKKSDPLPKPGDAYRAHARFLNRLAIDPRMIHFVDGNCFSEGFSYADLRRVRWIDGGAGGGPVLVLRFVEAVVVEVRIEGRNLDVIHHWISEGRMPWVWVQPKGFKTSDDKAVVITLLTITEIEP